MLERYLAKKLGGDETFVTELIQSARQGNLCLVSDAEPLLPLGGAIVRDANRYYLHRNWVYETELLAQVQRLLSLTPPPFSPPLPTGLLPEQLLAIQTALSHSFCLICGGPGTGKTHTAAALVRLFASSQTHIALAAPTGKAASHLARSVGTLPNITTSHLARSVGTLPNITTSHLVRSVDTPPNIATSHLIRSVDTPPNITTSTLHRLLKTSHRIDADLVVVDEGSMIDIALWVRLLSAIGPFTRLVILGDPDQLPPIEAGNLFAEMAPLFGVSLHRCMRTDLPHLHALAAAIRTGDADQMLHLLPPLSSFDFPLSPWTGATLPDPQIPWLHYRRLGILNALRQGPYGADALQQRFLDQMARQITHQWWAIPILVTTNNIHLELYNGTMGILIGQGSRNLQRLSGAAWFPGPGDSLTLCPSPPPFEPAFCLSIHKAQGSEFEEVIALFPPGSERLGREALYTAVTRAKRKFSWAGSETTLRAMVQKQTKKMSGFTERIQRESRR